MKFCLPAKEKFYHTATALTIVKNGVRKEHLVAGKCIDIPVIKGDRIFLRIGLAQKVAYTVVNPDRNYTVIMSKAHKLMAVFLTLLVVTFIITMALFNLEAIHLLIGFIIYIISIFMLIRITSKDAFKLEPSV